MQTTPTIAQTLVLWCHRYQRNSTEVIVPTGKPIAGGVG